MSSSIDSENVCRNFIYENVSLRYSSDVDSLYGLLVATAVLGLAACPFTILLNALVMVAVKTKRRLQTHPNILLACLALTDLMVGLVAQPLHITKTILLLQGKDFYEFCDVNLAFNVSFVMLAQATSWHLLLISGERFFAIKHTFTHADVVTKARLMACSALAWVTAALLFLLISYIPVVLFAYSATNILSIFLLQILVYKEARRHEQQILSEQVSEEARANFKKEMKALKLTTIILVTIFLCFFFPTLILFGTWEIFKDFFSPDVKTLFRHFGLLPVIINSVINPIIYTVRKREFRVAFIELILKKNFQEAEEFERKLFNRSTNNAVGPQDGQAGEGLREQNAEERNQVNDDNQEDNPQVIASGANFHENTNLASQNEPVSSNALNSTTTKTEVEHGDGRNPAHPENQQEDVDNPKVFTCGANLDDNTNRATQNEPVSSNAINSTFNKTEQEHDEGINPTHANNKQEYNSEVIASGANIDDNTNLTSKNEPVLSNALLSTTSEKSEEEHDSGGSPKRAQNNLEDNPGGFASSANFDGNTNLGSQFEPVSLHYLSNALNGKKSEQAEEERGEGRYLTHTRIKQDNPGSLAPSAYFDDNTNTNLAFQNEPFLSDELDSTSEQTCTEDEHGEGEKPEHAEVLAACADFDGNTNLASQNEPVSSNALNSTPKKKEEEHRKGRKPAHP